MSDTPETDAGMIDSVELVEQLAEAAEAEGRREGLNIAIAAALTRAANSHFKQEEHAFEDFARVLEAIRDSLK